METKKAVKPMNMSEMLPFLKGIVSKEDIQKYSEQYKPPPPMSTSRSSEKTYKPFTIAELSSVIERLNPHSSKKPIQALSARKKKWNTSVKVDNKKINRTANGQMRYNPVRKVLDVTSNSKIPFISRIPVNADTPKFPKQEYKAKKSFSLNVRSNVRISGVCAIPDISLINRPIKMSTCTMVNKENIPEVQYTNHNITTPAPSKVSTCKKLITYDTPQLQEYMSSSDISFLQREKEIEDIEGKNNVICKEQALEKITETPLPMSTPFTNFKSAKYFFNDSSQLETSALHDNNTIISFDEQSPKENNREETVIVSLCDLMNRANLSDCKYNNAELNDLMELENENKIKIKMIEHNIETLNKIKEIELKSLETITNLIAKKTCKETSVDNSENVKNTKNILNTHCSVIKTSSKTTFSQIPKKSSSLRKSVISKSVPNVSILHMSPHGGMNEKALSMYMKMKKHITFLNTPVKSERKAVVTQTTATATVTSFNLQSQLDKLYEK